MGTLEDWAPLAATTQEQRTGQRTTPSMAGSLGLRLGTEPGVDGALMYV